jgi:hypothetical protein
MVDRPIDRGRILEWYRRQYVEQAATLRWLVDTEGVMRDTLSNQAKDEAQAVIACLRGADFFAHVSSPPQSLEAVNDNHRSWPQVPFSPGWYITCLGDRDTG